MRRPFPLTPRICPRRPAAAGGQKARVRPTGPIAALRAALLGLAALSTALLLLSASAASALPAIQAPAPVYDFAPVPEGVKVRHDFIIRNTGDAELVIHRTESDCGCTTAEVTRQIPAGGESRVHVVLDTANEAGKLLAKHVILHTNDPLQPRLILTIRGQVEEFVSVSPRVVRLSGAAGERIAQRVEIRPGPNHPFRILAVKAKKGEHIRLTLEPQAADGTCRLTVENLKTEKGRFFDTLVVETDHPLRPVIEIGVFGLIS